MTAHIHQILSPRLILSILVCDSVVIVAMQSCTDFKVAYYSFSETQLRALRNSL